MTDTLRAECRQVLASVSAYLDGDLEATSCESIETHRRHCQTCGKVITGVQETIGLCRQAGAIAVPEPVRQRARASVRRLLDTQR